MQELVQRRRVCFRFHLEVLDMLRLVELDGGDVDALGSPFIDDHFTRLWRRDGVVLAVVPERRRLELELEEI